MEPGREALPGYRLLAPLGRGGFGEVWKCEAPGGLLKAVKFVQRDLAGVREVGPADEELQAIHRVKAIRHPFLLSLERVELVGNELVIVMELADCNLAEVFHRQYEAGRIGIPREQLLGYLRDAAEALDLMNLGHNLLHLDIKPQNLFVVSDRVKVGDFGLVHHLQRAAACPPSAAPFPNLTPAYAAPELFGGAVSPSADQYSLAIVYQQLLTGSLPLRGANIRQFLLLHAQGAPNLDPLPACDRAHVARALAKTPAARFPSCTEFMNALLGEGAPARGGTSGSRSRLLRRQPATVLLAEDNTFFRTLVQSMLEEWGFKVVAVPDGNAAWEILQQPSAPRLVILDWQMPGLDGMEVCRRLRAQDTSAPPYVILLTGQDGMENKVMGLREGADEYLTKPVAREELHARLRVGCRIVGLQLPPA
jgi:CheY-like chemotaxis protein